MDSERSTDRSNTFNLNAKIGTSTYLVKFLKKSTSIQSIKTSLTGYTNKIGLGQNWEIVHEGRRLPTTTWSFGIVVSDEDVIDGAVWRISMQTPLHEYYAKCMSRYQGASKLIDKNDVLLYDELCVNVALSDNSDGKSIPVEESVSERAKNAIHLYAPPRSNEVKLQISEGKFHGLGIEMNNRVNFFQYSATFADREIVPLTEHTFKSAVDIELKAQKDQKMKVKVHPPKPTFFRKSPFRVLDEAKTPYALGFNSGDILFLQAKRIMRAKAKVQDFQIEPGATVHVVKTIVITIEEIGTKKRQLQLPIPESQWLVSDLKFALFEHTCVLPSSIVLTKDGVEMQNDDFVSQYDVVEDSVIFMELHNKPFVDDRHPQTIVVHFNKLPSKSPLRLPSNSKPQPIVVDIDSAEEDDKNHRVKPSSNNSSGSKNLKRKLDFDNVNEDEPPKKKILWKNSISSDSASEGDERRKHANLAQEDSHNNSADEDDYSGINDANQSDESESESSEEKSNGDESSQSSRQHQARKKTRSNDNNNSRNNKKKSNSYKLKTNEQPKQKAGSFTQRTDKSRLTHSAIITNLKQFPHGAEIKDIQGVSIWENQIIYFVLMSTNDGLRSAWITSELLGDLSPKVMISYLERKMQFRK